ncbi:MAG: RNA pseudouridine synthase [Opitutus sp.]|nr:RNA pseudouridine synthase [Opitutus sp.]
MSTPAAEFWESLPLGNGVTLLHRDANGLAAFNKPAGVLSHPNMRSDEPRALLTCRYDLEAQCFVWDANGMDRRLWLLNRLDSATSGVILVAGDADLARAIREQFAKKKVRKIYNALVFGKPAERAQLWRDLIAVQKKGGQVRSNAVAGNIPSVTQFLFLQHHQAAFSTSLVRLEPHTGRSHQLRVQCAKRHLPIVGDQTYGDFALNRSFAKATGDKRLFLHSLETSFTYEFGGRSHSFKASAPLPDVFRRKY